MGLIQQGTGSKTAKIAPHTVTGLSVGDHTLQVRAFDATGRRDETPATVQWRVLPVDTIMVASPAATALPHSPVSFDIRSSAANWAYEYRIDGGAWRFGSMYSSAGSNARASPPTARTDVTKYTDHTRSERQTISAGSEGAHTLEVRAFNDCGEVGESVFASWRTTWVQTSIIQPPPRGTVDSSSAEFIVEVGPSRPSFQWQLDGGPWAPPPAKAQPSAGTHGVLVPLEGLSDGRHTLIVRAVDYQGRADSEPATFHWNVDTAPPSTRLERVALPPGQPPSEAEFSWSCEDATPCTYRYRLNGGEWVATAGGSARFQALAPGRHILSVAAVDAAGNIDPSPATHVWEVDTATPVTSIAQAPYKYSPERTAHFEFITSREGCSLRYSLNGRSYLPTSHSLGLYDLPDGQHTLRVYATDKHGQEEPSPAVYTWVVDTQPPKTVVHQWFFSPEERGVALFSVGIEAASAAGSDPIFDYQYQVCGGECSEWLLGPKTTRMTSGGYELRVAGLRVGTYVVNMRASDRAGNTDPTPASIEVHYDGLPGDAEQLLNGLSGQPPVDATPDIVAAELTELSNNAAEPSAGRTRNLQRHDTHNASWSSEGSTGVGDEDRGYLSHLFAWITGPPSDVEGIPKAELRRRASLRREL